MTKSSKPATFIVDAYNAVRRLLPDMPSDLGQARQALESRLRAFQRCLGRGARILLVYDGSRGLQAPPRRDKAFEVYFARPPQKADDLILGLCRRLEGEGEIHVVTSDVTDIAGRLGGLRVKRWTAESFADLVSEKLEKASRRAPDAKPKEVPSHEVSRWLEEFGFQQGRGSSRDA